MREGKVIRENFVGFVELRERMQENKGVFRWKSEEFRT